MKLTKIALSTIMVTSLTISVLPSQVDASGTSAIANKMTDRNFNKKVQTIKRDYSKIPVNIRAGYYIDPKEQTITIVIKNLKKNVKYKNAIIKKYGKNNLIFKTALYSEQGLNKAKLSLEKYINSNDLRVAGYGTDIYLNKIYVQIVKSDKNSYQKIKNKFKSSAYHIQLVNEGPQID